MDKMKELYEKVAKDSALQAKFAEILGDTEKAGEEATKEKLSAFAKEAGYEVSFEDAQDFFKSLAEEKKGSLSDEELDAVAGGKMYPGPGPGFGPGPSPITSVDIFMACPGSSLYVGAPRGCSIF